jgi:putative ABC transport system substrate-binding protein
VDAYGFFDELRQQGFAEDANLSVDGKFEVDPDQSDAAAAEVAKMAPDAVVCVGTPAVRAGQRATATIPIVALDDLVGSNLVSSLGRPDSNTTGVSILQSELDAKRQELLMDLVPSARRMAALADPNYPHKLSAVQQAADARGVELSVHWVANPDEIGPAIEAEEKAGAQALNVLGSGMLYVSRDAIYDGAARARLPAIYEWPHMAEQGGLIAYGPPLPSLYRQLARQLVKVLNGARPANIPVEQPTKFSLIINLKTAKTLGLTIPASLLVRTDKVIE